MLQTILPFDGLDVAALYLSFLPLYFDCPLRPLTCLELIGSLPAGTLATFTCVKFLQGCIEWHPGFHNE